MRHLAVLDKVNSAVNLELRKRADKQLRSCVTLLMFCICAGCQQLSRLDDISFGADAGARTKGSNAVRADKQVDADAEDAGAARAAPGAEARRAGCLLADGDECDLRSCPCGPNLTCRATGIDEHLKCESFRDVEPWRGCSLTRQCPSGQTCDRGSCRPYCVEDEDCAEGSCVPAGTRSGEPSRRFKVCWKRCNPSADDNPCAEGTSCRTLTNPFGVEGSYCVAPLDPCPKTEDGVCDEPQGTGLCARGTDEHDCGCASAIGDGSCDPVAQCGCGLGATCVVEATAGPTSMLLARCSAAGERSEGEPCGVNEECAPGLFCPPGWSVCMRYCGADSDCGSGACSFLPAASRGRVGLCVKACRSNDACPQGTVCAQIDARRTAIGNTKMFTKTGQFCFVPLSTGYCPHDGICDDPTGTHLCTAGADEADCCRPPGGQGACNPYKQCGCSGTPGTSCVLTDVGDDTACVPPGPLPVGSICNRASGQCEAGTSCLFNVCRKYCGDATDCGGHPNVCLKGVNKQGQAPEYGWCMTACEPGAADTCPDGTLCALPAPSVPNVCMVPDGCSGNTVGDGTCNEPRPGGTRSCRYGTDTVDCCALAPGQVCNPKTNCGCEHFPGTVCRMGDGENVASCLPIHPEPLSAACESVTDPSCCNPPVVGSECDPVKQCGCEGKPNTHCQVVDSSGVAGCMAYGKLPEGAACSSAFGQCSKGFDCDFDGVCRKACIEHTDCVLTKNGTDVNQLCVKPESRAVGQCYQFCDFDSEKPCVPGTRCARFGPDLTVCINPRTVCSDTDNQQCDDIRPGGTRLCAYGTDPECK